MTSQIELVAWHRTAISWAVVAELVRRHPDAEVKHDWHHISDSLQVHFAEQQVTMLNRGGAIWDLEPDEESQPPSPGLDTWQRANAVGPRRTAVLIEQALKLRVPAVTPPTIPKSLCFRVASALCSASLLRGILLDPTWALNSDSNGFGPVVEDAYLERFPEAVVVLSASGNTGRLKAAQSFWAFIERRLPESGELDPYPRPMAVIHTSGLLWTRDGREIDLMSGYVDASRRLEVLVGALFPMVAGAGTGL